MSTVASTAAAVAAVTRLTSRYQDSMNIALQREPGEVPFPCLCPNKSPEHILVLLTANLIVAFAAVPAVADLGVLNIALQREPGEVLFPTRVLT